jgi:hypothetical protein
MGRHHLCPVWLLREAFAEREAMIVMKTSSQLLKVDQSMIVPPRDALEIICGAPAMKGLKRLGKQGHEHVAAMMVLRCDSATAAP